MNTLLQDESLLIGSREEIQKLATKDSARILVVSDSHGAYSNLLLILRQFGVASDALVFCGDGICDISKLISNAVDEAEIKATFTYDRAYSFSRQATIKSVDIVYGENNKYTATINVLEVKDTEAE